MPDLSRLPADPRSAALGEPFFTPTAATPLPEPRLLHFNTALAEDLGLEGAPDQGLLAQLAGNAAVPGYPALAGVYAGHQFGQWVPRLGDGRALLIAEIRDRRGQHQELQLKGAGPTPYSRFGDGRAVLRSSVREYLASEAMHALGVPTTRALSLVGSPLPVQRETRETAAIVCRVAPSFLRFGHLEYFYYRDQPEALRRLADHLLQLHHPELLERPQPYAAWLAAVVDATAALMAQWQALGFCHGVMNTDNMSLLGLTLDYGPFGFQDGFAAGHICNHSDEGGRYAYDQQPQVAHWNLSRLLQASLPLLHEDGEAAVELATGILNRYPPAYTGAMMNRWRAKFGWQDAHHGDRELINRFLNLLDREQADFTRAFRALAALHAEGGEQALRAEIHDHAGLDAWLGDYRARLRAEQSEDAARAARLNAVNPLYVLRNHLAQDAITALEQGHSGPLERLFARLQRPYEAQPGGEADAQAPVRGTPALAISCSS